MGILETIKNDIQSITTDTNGFGVNIALTTPDDSLTVNVIGLHTKHHLGINEDGQQVNSKNAHIAISEQVLIDAGYIVRNISNEVALVDHKVVVADSTGVDKNYVIRQSFPDETIGLIVCILGDRI